MTTNAMTSAPADLLHEKRYGTTYSVIVGRVVTAARKAQNLSQRDLAKGLGLTRSSFSRFERGLSAFTVHQLAMTAALLGLTTSGLILRVEAKIRQAATNRIDVGYALHFATSPRLVRIDDANLERLLAPWWS